MSASDYALGFVLVVAVVAPLAVAATRIRSRYFPLWGGAHARLAEVTIALALLFGVLQLLGTIGLFRRGAIVAGCVIVAGLLTVLVRSGPQPSQEERRRLPTPARWEVVAAFAMVAVVVAQWSTRVLLAVDQGITSYDSLHYHLPHAAQFVQTGWITRLYLATPEFPDMFHPDNAELLHGTGMALLGRDLMSPLLNVGWLGLALLAGWCVGRPYGAAPVTLAATAAVMASPQMVTFQSASALTDIPSLALFLAAVAILLHRTGSRSELVLASAAAGMAMGTKLTVLVSVMALVVGLVVVAGKRQRWATLAAVGVPLVATGSYWYVRNLARGASPIPMLKLGVGPLALPHTDFERLDAAGHSVLDYLTDTAVWRDWYLPGLDHGLGPGWWLLGALTVAGLVALVVWGDGLHRVLAVAGAGAIGAWLVNPVSALGFEGEPRFFELNLRYAFAGVLVALVVAPTLPALRNRRAQLALLAVSGLLLVSCQLADDGPFAAWPGLHRRDAAAIAVVTVLGLIGVALAAPHVRRLSRPVIAIGVVAALNVALAAGFVYQRRYVSHRYTGNRDLAWLAGAGDTRIGFVGFDLGYLLYGPTVSNRVQYVGRRGPRGAWHDIDDCATWRSALAAGDYEYVAHWQVAVDPDHPREEWTRTDPSATQIFRSPNEVVYRLDAAPDPSTCPD